MVNAEQLARYLRAKLAEKEKEIAKLRDYTYYLEDKINDLSSECDSLYEENTSLQAEIGELANNQCAC